MTAAAARRAQQAVLALVFLTRLPLARLLPDRVIPLGTCLWAFPIAGAVIGAIAALPMVIFGPGLLTAAMSLTLTVWFTGGLHEDGLADLADGMGGQDREDRLRIMRDSRIGAYGGLALILSLLLRWSAMGALAAPGIAAVLITAAAGGRLAAVVTMTVLPPARSDGLGNAAGTPGLRTAGIAGLVFGGVVLALLAFGWRPGVPALAIAVATGAAATAFICGMARRRLGGQTGDVLGAVSVVTETAILVAFVLTN